MKKYFLLGCCLIIFCNFLNAQQYGPLNNEQINLIAYEASITIIEQIKKDGRTNEFIEKAQNFYKQLADTDNNDNFWALVCMGAVNNMVGYNANNLIDILLVKYNGSAKNVPALQKGAIQLSIGGILYSNIDMRKRKWKI